MLQKKQNDDFEKEINQLISLYGRIPIAEFKSQTQLLVK